MNKWKNSRKRREQESLMGCGGVWGCWGAKGDKGVETFPPETPSKTNLLLQLCGKR